MRLYVHAPPQTAPLTGFNSVVQTDLSYIAQANLIFAAVFLPQPLGAGIISISHHTILQNIFIVLSPLFVA